MISSTPDSPEEGQVIISLICKRKALCCWSSLSYAQESAFSPGQSPGPQGAAGEAAASQLLEAFNAHVMLCSWVTPPWRGGDSFRDLPKSLPALW